jgi:hypothetical protein
LSVERGHWVGCHVQLSGAATAVLLTGLGVGRASPQQRAHGGRPPPHAGPVQRGVAVVVEGVHRYVMSVEPGVFVS